MIKSLEAHQSEQEKERQRILQMSEVSIWLYDYNDLFSDFDPRSYSERALSEDFLAEAKKISLQKTSGQVQLNLSVPEKSRDAEKEKVIKKRLKDHFKRHFDIIKADTAADLKKGMIVAGLGLVLMFLSAIVRTLASGLWHNILMVLLEPSGWFMAWYGFDKIIDIIRTHKSEQDFYEKMAQSDVNFISY